MKLELSGIGGEKEKGDEEEGRRTRGGRRREENGEEEEESNNPNLKCGENGKHQKLRTHIIFDFH